MEISWYVLILLVTDNLIRDQPTYLGGEVRLPDGGSASIMTQTGLACYRCLATGSCSFLVNLFLYTLSTYIYILHAFPK